MVFIVEMLGDGGSVGKVDMIEVLEGVGWSGSGREMILLF